MQYGTGIPLFHRLAIHLLSQVTSSSACERNWISFRPFNEMNLLDTKMARACWIMVVHKMMETLSFHLRCYKTMLNTCLMITQSLLTKIMLLELAQVQQPF